MTLTAKEFERLALAEVDAVSRVARSLAHNDAEAEDLTQETYLKAIKARERFTLHANGMRPWLLKILHNTWFNRLDRKSREPELMQPELIDDLPRLVPAEVPAGFTWKDSDHRLVSAIEQLPESLRTTVLLWAIEELTYRDIAEVTSVPIGTVMSRLHRARATLVERLGPLAAERGVNRE